MMARHGLVMTWGRIASFGGPIQETLKTIVSSDITANYRDDVIPGADIDEPVWRLQSESKRYAMKMAVGLRLTITSWTIRSMN